MAASLTVNVIVVLTLFTHVENVGKYDIPTSYF